MPVHDRILDAARHLAATRPLDEISLAEVAREAGVSWPTVRRHLGSTEELRRLLAKELPQTIAPAEDTRSRILAAAKRTFARLGYNGATIDEIGADAGLTKGAVYWHFASKRDLFKAILAERRAREMSQVPDFFARITGAEDVEDAIIAGFHQDLEDLKANKDWIWLFLEFLTSSREPEIRQELIAGTAEISRMVNALMVQLKKDGFIAEDVDPIVLARLWGAMIDGLALASLFDKESEDLTKLAPQLGRIFWRGFAPTKVPRRKQSPASKTKRKN